jgi:hypothetical protein
VHFSNTAGGDDEEDKEDDDDDDDDDDGEEEEDDHDGEDNGDEDGDDDDGEENDYEDDEEEDDDAAKDVGAESHDKLENIEPSIGSSVSEASETSSRKHKVDAPLSSNRLKKARVDKTASIAPQQQQSIRFFWSPYCTETLVRRTTIDTPIRVDAIIHALKQSYDSSFFIESKPASHTVISLFHNEEYVSNFFGLEHLTCRMLTNHHGMTNVDKFTVAAVQHAVGAVIDAIDLVLESNDCMYDCITTTNYCHILEHVGRHSA